VNWKWTSSKDNPETPDMPDRDDMAADSRFHSYRSNDIPWYVRLMWLGFWTLAVVYTIRYLFPALQSELFEVINR
jgi:hypothetical protein